MLETKEIIRKPVEGAFPWESQESSKWVHEFVYIVYTNACCFQLSVSFSFYGVLQGRH